MRGSLEKIIEWKSIIKKNQGAAVARNHGIRKATGDYLLFPDSDDYYASSLGFEEINNQLEETKADVLIHDSLLKEVMELPMICILLFKRRSFKARENRVYRVFN